MNKNVFYEWAATVKKTTNLDSSDSISCITSCVTTLRTSEGSLKAF